MVCEEYRDGLMALLDGEISDAERADIERHVSICPHCNSEFTGFQKLALLTHQCNLPHSHPINWKNYYTGVCRKMEGCASWKSWSAVSFLLLAAGCLMLFGFSHNVLALMLAGLAMASGAALLWLSYFCNCTRH